jgi:flagellar hook-length control protein FliK
VNITALPELLLAWVKTQGAALLQSDKTPPPTFQAGQQYEGKVLDNLASGRHLVNVGGQLLDMNLPARTQPGDSVRLTYLSAGPRPAFLLNQSVVSPAQQVQISNTAQQVNALLRLVQAPATVAPMSAGAAATTGGAGTAKATPVTTPVTNTIANTASAPGQPTSTRAATPSPESSKAMMATTSSSPLPAAGSLPARPIVANVMLLQNYSAAIQSTTAALTGPNTGLLGQAIDAPRAAISASTTLSANTLIELPSAARHMLPVRLSQTVSESGMFYESHLAKWSRGTLSLETIQREPQARIGQEPQTSTALPELGGMPEEAGRLAGRQLQMLEGAPFIWQGPAWPGQVMEWQVREESAGEGQGESGETASEWVTELNLTLPRMGSVHAQLGLAGDRLRLRLLATEEATRDALAAALPALVKGFEASGLHAVDMQVDVTHGEA